VIVDETAGERPSLSRLAEQATPTAVRNPYWPCWQKLAAANNRKRAFPTAFAMLVS
jgi:hypothetical protein